MLRAETKVQRLIQLENLLIAHPEGLTQSEISRRLGVDRSTIHRYLTDLPGYIYIDEEDDDKVKIDTNADLISVKLNIHEALALHLSTRLLATRIDRKNPHAASALRKLGVPLKRLAPLFSRHIIQSADVLDGNTLRDEPEYLKVLQELTIGWAGQRKVRITHLSEKLGKVFEYLVSPYFIEPYAIGHTSQLICHSEPPGKLRTYKIERIRTAELTIESYKLPDAFDPRTLLKDAWSIWYTDEEPEEVILKFTSNVVRRVQETQWHHSAQEMLQPDGHLVWKAKIAEPLEMLPWIRGWGADCEVVAPPWLRKKLEIEALKIARVYGVEVLAEQKPLYYAHSRENDEKEYWQPLKVHLLHTAKIARKFGENANIAELAYIAGLLHDLGKYSAEFQKRLNGGPKVDHSTAGAQELINILKNTPRELFARLLVYPILGHHAGLPDYGSETDLEGSTVCARLKSALPDYNAYKSELDLSELQFPQRLHIHPQQDRLGFSLSFLIRMVYSSLLDADFLETESYMQGARSIGANDSIPSLRDKLDAVIQQFNNPTKDINRWRTATLQACINKGNQASPGFFSLTVPTGGGKTISSMAFALHHAAEHGLRRIIYVIPFTSIIEQNAEVFKGFFGNENVLEHHSNSDWRGFRNGYSDDRTNSIHSKLRLAAENWDIPIVVTTNVQFFESLFSNAPSRCRKLHNISSSVVIFDEAQMLPREYLQPTLAAVWELVANYRCSAVFCTATQPCIERFLPVGTVVDELAPDPQALFTFYKRVAVHNLGTITDEELLNRIDSHKQALCIVNTRRHASGLFYGLKGEGNFHLSTLMCPAHRKETLREVKERLKENKPCRIISTTVLEAGIDVDFPVGYRALSGLDSLNQAAGRVNREMRYDVCDLFIFEPKSDLVKKVPILIKQSAEVARMVLRDFAEEPISIAAIDSYFNTLYDFQDPTISFDSKQIMHCFKSSEGKFYFEKAASEFRIIEDPTEQVIIPYTEEAIQLFEELKNAMFPYRILRRLQPYTVSIFTGEFDRLRAKGVVLTIDDAYHVLNTEAMREYYDSARGLLVPESSGGDGLFF